MNKPLESRAYLFNTSGVKTPTCFWLISDDDYHICNKIKNKAGHTTTITSE